MAKSKKSKLKKQLKEAQKHLVRCSGAIWLLANGDIDTIELAVHNWRQGLKVRDHVQKREKNVDH